MTYIIETPTQRAGSEARYEIVEGANHISLSEAGALLVWSDPNRHILAIYQPGEWTAARKDGVARKATASKIFEPISVATFGQPQSN